MYQSIRSSVSLPELKIEKISTYTEEDWYNFQEQVRSYFAQQDGFVKLQVWKCKLRKHKLWKSELFYRLPKTRKIKFEQREAEKVKESMQNDCHSTLEI